MYRDDDSVEVFNRMHARDVMIEQARHLKDPVEDTSLFSSHARGERKAGLLMTVLGIGVIALLASLLFKSL